jgi:hypothetical protein
MFTPFAPVFFIVQLYTTNTLPVFGFAPIPVIYGAGLTASAEIINPFDTSFLFDPERGVEVRWVVDVVQPATDKEATTSNRTIIAVIGFNCICVCKRPTLA